MTTNRVLTHARHRWAYGAKIAEFLADSPEAILGALARASQFADELSQKAAWLEQIRILKGVLAQRRADEGRLFFEYEIPRLGRRVDVVLILEHVVYVIEFKVGSASFDRAAVDQVWDYALDLKNFHETSHAVPLVPILVATRSDVVPSAAVAHRYLDQLASPLLCGERGLGEALQVGSGLFTGAPIDPKVWQSGRYMPTPTIVEAAKALYAGHAVADISRSDAGAVNLALTSVRISEIIEASRSGSRKAICFVTGVPGAGKTLVGLDVANKHTDKDDALYSVFLSGNGPLVAVLHEALARDRVGRADERGEKLRIGEARSAVKQFIQNVHHFRDDCLKSDDAPIEHVALFDEAQRAWDLAQTANFMQRKKGYPGFAQSEPEFLISCLDRHSDWAVIVCLVGSGQEINTGEAGISEWLSALRKRFPHWNVHLSPRLRDIEFHADAELAALEGNECARWEPALHLGISMRSFRAERASEFVNALLALELEQASEALQSVLPRFPVRVTRDLEKAKRWMRDQARGSERYGLLVSSQAQRLKPHAIDVRVKVDPVHWFLYGKDDVRSSYYLEDAATEFQIQGLELDWSCVVWDGDLRLQGRQWDYFGFKGRKWQRVLKQERQRYLLNAYRVLLTRARQGMVIVVPTGSTEDPTRKPEFYDSTYSLLTESGIPVL